MKIRYLLRTSVKNIGLMEKSGQLRASVIKNGGNEAKGPVTGFSKKKGLAVMIRLVLLRTSVERKGGIEEKGLVICCSEKEWR